ncbi:MAG: CBS domain-containing protein [Planctomycetaceae bacterium]|nr:CBS domain-containing protein [Planctomycetaceae bacterium]
MTVREVMGPEVLQVDIDDTLETAERVLQENHLGCVPVIHSEVIAGVLTGRDVRTAAARCDPKTTYVGSLPLHTIGDLQSGEANHGPGDEHQLAAISDEATVEEALEQLADYHAERLVVHDKDFQIIGTVTRDALRNAAGRSADTAEIH